ncbi:MFS transporter [Saccharolobus caldissimus]|uniref:MFS transporter n=1 Tax=Saccharolobus caldissimus TaxID=1702097 RepID=A0AAQ4CTE2_9CREN|nr:MFS transporter [Saccharolobus caldissimus]BDB99073.1 MFS transporter [Saccharolobus caldissimus]
MKKESLVYIIIIIVLSTLSARAVNNMITTTVPLLAKYDLNMDEVYVGILSASFSIFTLISTTFINPFLVSFKRKIVFILSSILIIPLLVLLYMSNQITIWIVFPITGFIYGFIMPNLITFASLGNSRRESERLLNIYSTSLSLSLVIGPILETILLKQYNYRDIFLLFLPLAIPLAILSKYVKFPEIKNEIKGFNTFKNDGLIAAILSITSYNIPFAVITTFIAIYAKELFNVENFAAYSVFIPFFFISFLTRFYMALRPFNNLRKPMLISIFLTIIGIITVSFSPNFLTLLIGMLILGVPHGSIFPMSTVMITRSTSVSERNAANSFFLAYNNILFTISPIIYGYLVALLRSNYRLSFALLLIPLSISAILLIKLYWKNKILLG